MPGLKRRVGGRNKYIRAKNAERRKEVELMAANGSLETAWKEYPNQTAEVLQEGATEILKDINQARDIVEMPAVVDTFYELRQDGLVPNYNDFKKRGYSINTSNEILRDAQATIARDIKAVMQDVQKGRIVENFMENAIRQADAASNGRSLENPKAVARRALVNYAKDIVVTDWQDAARREYEDWINDALL